MIPDLAIDDSEGETDTLYLTAAELRREFRLTDAHLARLGPGDGSELIPGNGPAHYRQVYGRERVEHWVAENRSLIEESDARRARSDARREREHQTAEAERRDARRQVVAALRDAELRELPPLEYVRARVARPPRIGQDAEDRISIDTAILNYALAKLTGYPEIARLLNRLGASFELTAAVRVHVCCRIIRHYQLTLDPLATPFLAGAKAMLPRAFSAGNPEAAAEAILASES